VTGIRNRIAKSEFAKHVLTLITGTTIAQIIPVLLQLVLRRVYSTEDFGAFAVYLSVTGIIIVVSTLRYEMAVVLPEKDKDAANIFSLSLFISIIFNLIIFIIILLFKSSIAKFLDFPVKYSYWLYFIPLSAFLFSSYQTVNYWLIRKKAFKSSSLNKIVRRSSEGITQVGFGYIKNPFGLFIGDIIGNTANNIAGYIQMFRHDFKLSYLSLVKIKYVMRKYKEFPQFQAIPALLNTASLLLPVIIINKLYSESITAQFDLSRMVLALPIALIAASLSQVLLQKISEKRRKKSKISMDILKISLVSFSLAVPGVIIMLIWGPDIFDLAFGAKWREAGEFTRILVFTYAIQFVVSPLGMILIALERIKIVAIWQTSYFVLITCLFLLKGYSIIQFITVYMYITIFVYIIYWFLIVKVARDYDNSVSK